MHAGHGTWEDVQTQCVKEQSTPTTDDGSCTADDIPDCDNVTVDEYVKCTGEDPGVAGFVQRTLRALSGVRR